MKIDIRKVSKYYECDISEGSAVLHIGLLDKGECESVAAQFRQAADALFPILVEPDEPRQR